MALLTFDDEFNALNLDNGSDRFCQPVHDLAPIGLSGATPRLMNPMLGRPFGAMRHRWSVKRSRRR
jgi:hypothetical protein